MIAKSKFQGALVGALIGDCFGAPYESNISVLREEVQAYFDKLDGTYIEGPCKPYTDDTAMTKCITMSLIEKNNVDPLDLAQRFVTEYKSSPERGYGVNVVSVFENLLATEFADPFLPAKEQFGGRGSYGNGAAMRITPVALFYCKDLKKLIEMTKKVSKITHAHELGINGAILQSLAIQKCIFLNPKQKLDAFNFTSELIREMKKIEKHLKREIVDPYLEPAPINTYERQLKFIQHLLKKDDDPSDEEVVNFLGNFVSALYSVPTAIYVFLRAQGNIPGINTDNPFRRTIQYAVALGGDTDTIASMAGAIAGAYYGHEIISETMQKHCEYIKETIESADNLFSAFSK